VISPGCPPRQPEETVSREAGGDRTFAQHGNQHEVTNTLSKQRFDDHAVGCCGPRDVQHVLDRIEDGQCRSIPFVQALTGSALDVLDSIPPPCYMNDTVSFFSHSRVSLGDQAQNGGIVVRSNQ
jgi:hypothetical protein